MKKIFLIVLTLTIHLKSFANFQSCQKAANEVDIALVLSIDVSASIDDHEMRLQIQGYVDAFDDQEIREILESSQCVAIGVIVWSQYPQTIQNIVKIDSIDSIKLMQKNLLDIELRNTSEGRGLGSGTRIDQGIFEAMKLFVSSDLRAYKKIIDVSGDGTSDSIIRIRNAVNEAIQKEIEINGLPIEDTDNWSLTTEMYYERFLYNYGYESMTDYYHKEVITPFGFTETATTFEDFGNAIKRKIRRELSPLLF